MLIFLIGLAAGIFGGLVGVGGGVVMIPLMVGTLHFTQHQAHGTSLVALVFTGLSGAATYYFNGALDLAAAGLLAATAMITARYGARCAHALPEWRLKRAFGGFILLVAALLLIKPYLTLIAFETVGWVRMAVLLGAGVFTGFISGMMGVGGGTIMVPAMVLLAGFGQHPAQGTSLLAMVPTGMVGAYTHWRLGNVVLKVVPPIIPGIFLGSYLGGMLANRLPDGTLRVIFALLLVWTGWRNLKAGRP